MKKLNRKADRELNTDEARSKLFAVLDARRHDRENRHLWTAGDRQRLQGMAVRASSIYSSRVFTNLRQKFMVLKIENPRTQDRNSAAAIKFDQAARAEGVQIVRTKTALLYRIR